MRANNEKIRQLFPEQYERQHNVVLIPTKLTSEEKYKQNWFAKYRHQYIEVEAWEAKDWPDKIEPNQVLVKAALGGDPNEDWGYWFVPDERYQLREELGYIIHNEDVEGE